MSSVEEILGGCPLFEGVKPKDLRQLAKDAHEMTFPAGKTLAETDQFGSAFFVVVDGQVEVSIGGHVIRTCGAGGYFGEMAVIDKDVRSATVTATKDTTCLVFGRPVFRTFVRNHTEVSWALLEALVARVRDAEHRLAPV